MKKKHTIPDSIKKCAITDCQTVEEFAHKYRKKDRFIRRGQDYVNAIMASHHRELDECGYTCISHHDNVVGEFISYIE